MPTVLGTPGGIYKPDVKIGSEPISSLSAQFPVGQIARCSCGVRPESVADVGGGGQVVANGVALFTGTGWAPRGRATSASLDFGFSLIHPAHSIDEGRAWAPGLHPMSTEHYTFTMGAGGSDSRDTSLFGDRRKTKFDMTESLATEIPAYIVRVMKRAQQQRMSRNLESVGLEGSSAEGNEDVIATLESIEGLTDSKLDLEELGEIGLATAADHFAEQLVMNSITANKSAWDLLAMMYSAFGMQVICWPDGTIKACPDFTGCKPPDGNRIQGAITDTWEGAAEYNRSPRGVVIISYGMTRGASARQPSSGAPARRPIPQNHGEYIAEGATGGLFVTGLPNWMMAYQQGALPSIPEEAVEKYAKQIYAEVRNMGRTFVVTTPIAPEARPGTTYYFEPLSNAKNLTEGGDAETPFSAEYAGYCYKIVHSANSQGQFHTHWHFRNIFDPREYDLMVDEAPFFGDKPFKLGEEGGEDEDEAFEDFGSELTQTGTLTTGQTQAAPGTAGGLESI